MSRVWNSREKMSDSKLKVKLRSPQQRRSPSKYRTDFERDYEQITGKRSGKKRAASPAPSESSHSPSPERGRSRDRKKKPKKGRRESSSSSLSSLSSVSRSRSPSSSSSAEELEVFGKTNRKAVAASPYRKKKSKAKKQKSHHRKSHHKTPYSIENAVYYHTLEEDVNREKRADKCRTSKKAITFIDQTKNRSTTYLKRSGSLILAAKELEIQTHCHLSLHIQPTWPRGKQYRYLSGSNVHAIRSAEFADRWVGPNMCHVCGEQRETSLWLVCGHSSSRRKQGCTYRVHCHCIGLYYSSAIELGQVPFYCPKHGRARRRGTDILYEETPPQNRSDMRFVDDSLTDVNGSQRQLVERSNAGSVLVRDSNAPMGSELIHVIDSTTGLRSAVRVDSTTASGTEMLLHFHSSIVQSAEMTGDPNTAMVLEIPNDAIPVPEASKTNTEGAQGESGTTAETEQADTNTSQTEQQTAVVEKVIKTEKVDSSSESQQQIVEVPITGGDEQYSVPESQQVVAVEAVEQVQVEGEEDSNVVTDEANQVVAVEEVHMSSEDVVHGSEQVIVQEVEMEGEYVTVPEGSQMIVQEDGSQILVQDGAQMVMQDGAQMVVQDGTHMVMQDGGQMVMQEGGQMVVNEDGSELIVQDGSQIIVQPDGTQMLVQPDGTQMIVHQEIVHEGSEMVVHSQSSDHQLSSDQNVVFVSAPNDQGQDAQDGVVFQMAGESYEQSGEEITVYSQQQPAENADGDQTDNVVPTRLEKMTQGSKALTESQLKEVSEASNLPAGTEVIQVVEVQSDTNVETQ